ncbi:MAG TPA: glycosyltransferase family 4 protein [Candidatus Paceibacterota bacterium]|nr:glycosyltransferase family 4 protein [Candidatus Paceibacterota bacterium]
MKIIFLSDDFPPQSFGGAGISTYDLAIGMKEAGHQVFVITTCRKKDEAGEFNFNGLEVFKIASNYPGKWRSYLSLYNPFVVWRVKELLKKIKPDVVHVNNVHFYLSYYCLKLAKKYSKVVVFTARDVMTFNFGKLNTQRYLENFDAHTTWLDHLKQAGKRWNPFRNFFIRKYLKFADQIFAVSKALKEALEQNGIRDVEVMHSGIDIDLWQVSEVEKVFYRKKYNLENKKVILFGGRLSGAKGGGKTLLALVEVAKVVPEVVLLVVASLDNYTNQLKRDAERLGVGDKLIFTGWVGRDEIKYIYACVDLVLVPSICFDSFPRIVLEAMASGKPVISTPFGGAKEIIGDGITGYVVNPLVGNGLAEKVIDLLENSEKSKRFGQVGKERVKKYFNICDKTMRLIVFYENLIK